MAHSNHARSVVIVAIFTLFALIAVIWGMGQISQNAYQEGVRAGKATAQTTAYQDGYEKGYASAIYEVEA